MKQKLLAIVGSSLLGACSYGLMRPVEIPDSTKDMAQLDAAVQSRCAGLGYQQGTPDFNRCFYDKRMQIIQAAMVPVQPIPDLRPAAPPPPPIQTHCYSTAGVTNCSTY
ncbi:hypothetical protein [Caballeronia sp. ATUFL_M1_KS5A]|uniref:hypothetical protein n=1 Tax=Caballeronia sp. ATUFL_M1_KS5A TaxID=2921778 RepID=UPI002027BC57|nr:hypothetical protein [Caballeronia sp. ATUFL_M1_KS5A]